MTEKADTRFKPGQSGNPAGRKPGTGEVARLRAAIAEHLPVIINTLVADALVGDTRAARLLLERAIPPLRPEAQSAVLPEMAGAAGLVEKSQAVLEAAARGDLAPDVAAQIITALAAHGRLVELEDLQRQVDALKRELEQRHDLV